jgi:NADPH-dependent 2,4-dienoyl-CoA reductase/sulfur reductase-like enzyme/rhodanese-related sulfurtransferase
MTGKKRIIIIGGIAAGTAAAAKCRRMDERLEIVLYEKDKYISYGTCGLPYFVSGKIKSINKLLINTPEHFAKRFNVDVRTRHEVQKIIPEDKVILIRDLKSGNRFQDSYDRLILATGSDPVRIPLEGCDAENVFTLKTVKDSIKLKGYLGRDNKGREKSAVIIGGGFIGLELIEAFVEYGYRVSIVEKMDQLLPAFDREIVEYLENYLDSMDVAIFKQEEAARLVRDKSGLVNSVETRGGKKLKADLVFFGIGVRPNTGLARECGIKTGDSGAIEVDMSMGTSIEDIFAAGDCCQCRNIVSGELRSYNLASIANRQGWTAGYNAAGGSEVFSGSNITSMIRILDIAIGKTGLGYREAKVSGHDPAYIELHYNSHAGYYPGAELMHCLAVYEKSTGRLLGMQAIGKDGIDKRIDIAASAIGSGMDIRQLAELDLSYQPAYGSARDALNILGMIGENLKKGQVGFVDIPGLKEKGIPEGSILLDVRSEKEFTAGHIQGAMHIYVDELRHNLEKLDKDKEIIIYCKTGYRAYLALRILANEGFGDVKLLNGSYLSWMKEI